MHDPNSWHYLGHLSVLPLRLPVVCYFLVLGMQMFFKSHKCSWLCKKLGLKDIREHKEPTLRCFIPGSWFFSGLADFFPLWVVQHGLNTKYSWATARQYQHSGRSARQGGTVGCTEWFLYRKYERMHRTRLRLKIRGPLLPLASY